MHAGGSLSGDSRITRLIDTSAAKSNMRWVWTLGLGGIFFEAYSSTALASGLGPLTKILNLTPENIALLTSLSMGLAIILCPVAGTLSDRFGRLTLILAAKAIAFFSGVIAVTAVNYEMLVISRVLAGIAWSMDFGVVIAYLAELVPTQFQHRLNRWQGMWYVATTANLLISAAIYELGAGTSVWRYSLASAAIFAFVLFFLQLWKLPESPKWLASRGRHADAERAVRRVYHVTEPVPEKYETHAQPKAESVKIAEGLKELFGPKYCVRTILAAVPGMMQACQYFAIGWYLPVIALTLFGKGYLTAVLGTVFFNIFGIIGGFASTPLSKWLRMRRSMQFGFGGSVLILLFFGYHFGHMTLALSVAVPSLFILWHSGLAASGFMSVGAMAFPSRLRGLGMGVTTMANNIGAAIGLFVFPLLQAKYGAGGAIMITAVIPLIGFLTTSIIRWDPERTAADPEQDLAEVKA